MQDLMSGGRFDWPCGAYDPEVEGVVVVGPSPTECVGRVGKVDGVVVGVKLGVVPNLTVGGGDPWLGRAAIAESAGLVHSISSSGFWRGLGAWLHNILTRCLCISAGGKMESAGTATVSVPQNTSVSNAY